MLNKYQWGNYLLSGGNKIVTVFQNLLNCENLDKFTSTINTLVNKSSINAFSGIGIIVKKIVVKITQITVLPKNVLLIILYAINNNGTLIKKFIIPAKSNVNSKLNVSIIIVLNNCDIPSIPPLYNEFGTINRLIAKA